MQTSRGTLHGTGKIFRSCLIIFFKQFLEERPDREQGYGIADKADAYSRNDNVRDFQYGRVGRDYIVPGHLDQSEMLLQQS